MKNDDICCCCLVSCCYKDINQVYSHNGTLESYGEMLSNTFNVSLRRKSICEKCILKLREAAAFKKQIVEADLTLIVQSQQLADDDDEQKCEVKLEPEETNDALQQEDKLENYDDASMHSPDDEGGSEKNSVTIEIERKINKEKRKKYKNIASKILKKTAIPSIFPWKNVSQTPTTSKDQDSSSYTAPEPDEHQESLALNISQIQMTYARKKTRRVLKGPTKNTMQLISNSNLCIFKPFQNNTEYACYICKETCTNIKNLREHSKTHKLNDFLNKISALRGVTCRHVDISNLACICAHACEDLETLTTHLTEKHGVQFQNGGHLLIPYKLENGYQCVICKKEFNTFYTLTIHMNCHSTSNICDICGSAYFSRQYLRQHVKAKHRETTCGICLSKFPTAAELARHTKKIHKKISKREYQCKQCNLIFNYGYKLKNHMIVSHGMPEIKVDCGICGKVLKNEVCLRTHKRSVHEKERRFQCTLCDLRFFTNFDKARHERIHLSKSLSSCDYCQTKFMRKDSLRRHMKKQHTVSI